MKGHPLAVHRRETGAAWVKALTILLAAAVLAAVVVVLVREPGSGGKGVLVQESGSGGKADLDVLKGRWLRPDGGYVLEIRRVGADGSMDAAYFNPAPIRVSRATAAQEGGTTKVFVELDDPVNPNYRGCTYKLVHSPQDDVLTGVYHQAVIGQSYEVVFERIK